MSFSIGAICDTREEMETKKRLAEEGGLVVAVKEIDGRWLVSAAPPRKKAEKVDREALAKIVRDAMGGEQGA